MDESQSEYDRAITIFSPEGRLFQVEYAREAVHRGTPGLGYVYDGGVLLVADLRIHNRLIEPTSIEKLFQLSSYSGCVCSGLVGDIRVLVDKARSIPISHRLTFDEEISVESLVRQVSEFKRLHTQYGGVRPFGVAMLIGGIHGRHGPSLWETDVSGASNCIKAGIVGSGRVAITELLEESYDPAVDRETALGILLGALAEVKDDPLDPVITRVAYIEEDGFQEMDPAVVISICKELKLIE